MTFLNGVRQDLYSSLSFTSLFAIAAAFSILYGIALAVYRLYLSPLARFPGPKLAALTQLYEAYYDVVSGGGGNFSRRIKRMHEMYGKFTSILNSKESITYVFKVQLSASTHMRYILTIRSNTRRYMLLALLVSGSGSRIGSIYHYPPFLLPITNSTSQEGPHWPHSLRRVKCRATDLFSNVSWTRSATDSSKSMQAKVNLLF